MKVVQIHYYLTTPGGDYASLGEYIESLGSWAHIHESLWLVRTNKSVAEVRDELASRMRSTDRVVVFSVTADSWASFNIGGDVAEWIHEHLGTSPVAA